LPWIDYVDGLADIFMHQWNQSRLKRRSGHIKPK